jgi:hypothetical protein
MPVLARRRQECRPAPAAVRAVATIQYLSCSGIQTTLGSR